MNTTGKNVRWLLRALKQNWFFGRVFKKIFLWRKSRVERQNQIYSKVVVGGVIKVAPENLLSTYWVHSKSDLAKRVILTGLYEPEVFDIIKKVWNGSGTIVNIGANVGFWSIGLCRMLPNVEAVIAIEPNPSAFDLLEKNIDLNGMLGRVVPIKMCVAENSGDREFEMVDDMPEYSAIGSITHPAVADKSKIRMMVNSKPLGEIIGAISGRVTMILIDTEGAEYSVIKGARDILISSKPILVFECSSIHMAKHGHSTRMLVETLHEYGYIVRNAEAPYGFVSDNFEGEALAYPSDRVFSWLAG